MQVRDMKVGLMGEQNDFAALHASFGTSALQQQQQQNQQQQQQQTGSGGSAYNSGEHRAGGGPNGNTNGGSGGGASANTSGGNYPFTLPNPPINKDGEYPSFRIHPADLLFWLTIKRDYSFVFHSLTANPGSNSSTSSETSTSSQQNNGWSFEEQFKQVRQVSDFHRARTFAHLN